MVRNVRQWFCHSIAVEMVVNGVLRTLWVIVNETRCTCTKRSTLKEKTNVNHTKGIEAYMAILRRMGHAMDGALHGRRILWSGGRLLVGQHITCRKTSQQQNDAEDIEPDVGARLLSLGGR